MGLGHSPAGEKYGFKSRKPTTTTFDAQPTDGDHSLTYESAALDYTLAGFKVFPTLGKDVLPKGCTGRAGTVTEEKVHEWIADPKWAKGNTALKFEGYIGVDVDQYDNKHGADQLAELEAKLGELPATVTSSARGQGQPSRQNFYLIPDHKAEFVGKAAPDIDILQATHRYALVAPSIHPNGSAYVWYDSEDQPIDGIPDIGDFEMLPQTWIDYLAATPQEAHEGHTGTIESWLETMEAGIPEQRVRDWYGTVPTDNFGHDTMVLLAFNLVRLGAEGQSGIREALTFLYEAWLRFPYGTSENQKGIDDAVLGAILKAGARELEDKSLLSVLDIQYSADLWEAMSVKPLVDNGEAYKDARHTLILKALSEGLSEREVATLTWASVPGQRLLSDPAGLDTLWSEVRNTINEAPNIETAPAPVVKGDQYSFLTEKERAQVAEYEWFGSDYISFAETRVAIMNLPYHRLNRIMIMSVVLSDCGVIPVPGPRPLGTNIYMMNLGDTTTGKTEALDLALGVVTACSPFDDRPDLGGDFSPEALTDVLTRRDGKASLFNRDEADGFFEKAQSGGYTAGMIPALTALHGGTVPTIYRQGNKDVSGMHATTQFSMYLMGTIERLSAVLDKSLWESGFFARYIWTVGKPATVSDDMFRTKLLRGDQAVSYNTMPRQFAADMGAAKASLATEHLLPLAMDMTLEAEARLDEFNILTSSIPNGHRHADVLVASVHRFRTNILKVTILTAMSEGATVATLAHVLIAIEASEEWLTAMMMMIDETTASHFSRQVDKLEAHIRRQAGQKLLAEKAYSWTGEDKFQTDRLIAQLVAEGRVTDASAIGGKATLTIIERRAA